MENVKLVAVGDSTVGKTCLLISYCTNAFPSDYIPTVFDTYTANVMVDGRPFELSLWDTAAEDAYDRLRPLSYPSTNVVLLCFAVNNRDSFQNIATKWFPEISFHCPNASYVLIGLKSDLRNDTSMSEDVFVSTEEANALRRDINAYLYMETSALTTTNLKSTFDEAIRSVMCAHSHDDDNTKNQNQCVKAFCSQFFNYLYDAITGIISLADLITDVIVMYDFYVKQRMAFFVVSLIIIICAQIGYCGCFVVKYSNYKESYKDVMLFCSVMPIAPFLSFVFYLTSHREKWLSKVLKKRFNLYIRDYVPHEDDSPIIKFIEEKFTKHMGFMLEAFVEAFPQSILQMIAIVMYREANIVSIVSILISMVSVATKSLVFNIAIDYTTFIFNWLSMVTDFFGIFFTISWVFYHPLLEGELYSFTWIGYVWLGKLLFVVFPFVYWTGVSLLIFFINKLYKNNLRTIRRDTNRDPTCCEKARSLIIVSIFCGFVHFCGLVLGTMLTEIGCFSYIAWSNFYFITDRVSHSTVYVVQWWYLVFDWLNKSKSKQDLVLRIVCLWYVRLADKTVFRWYGDDTLQRFLHEKLNGNKFTEITLNDLKDNTSNNGKTRYFWGFVKEKYVEIYKDMKGQWNRKLNNIRNNYDSKCMRLYHTVKSKRFWGNVSILCNTFYFFPLYLLSRGINILFPVMIVLYLSLTGYWSHVDLFQYCMLGIYLGLILIWLVVATFALRRSYWIYHLSLFSGFTVIKSNYLNSNQRVMKTIQAIYNEILCIPKRKEIVLIKMGPHIGHIILSYLPNTPNIDHIQLK
eukprot:105343_1